MSLQNSQPELAERPQSTEEKLMRLNLLLHEIKTAAMEAQFGLEKLGEIRCAFNAMQILNKAQDTICIMETKHTFLQ